MDPMKTLFSQLAEDNLDGFVSDLAEKLRATSVKSRITD